MKTLHILTLLSLLSILSLISCSSTTELVDNTINNPNCQHSITIEQGEREDILRLKIVSNLDQVFVTVGNYPRTAINRHYYNCISYHIEKDEISIIIEAEETCEYTY